MDRALKQRLVGAGVLIALAVILVPMLLDGQPPGTVQQTQIIELPPRPEELNFETRRFPLANQPAPGSAATAVDAGPLGRLPTPAAVEPSVVADPGSTDAVVEEDSSSPEAPVAVSAEPEEFAPAAAVDTPAPLSTAEVVQPEQAAPAAGDTTAPEEVDGGRYMIQVASLSSDENARRLVAKLQQKDFAVLLDTVESAVGRLHRVRVGPFDQESQAAAALDSIRRNIQGVTPRVVDLQPDTEAVSGHPADPLARWVVQVGSFGEPSNADALVKRLRAEGLSAYQEVITSADAAIYRVRVGPFLQREVAVQTQRQLRTNLSVDGVVMNLD